ncbi:magnesium transporter [Bacillus sp. SORGH_AS 510]|uniref:magnesium transporter CorA family protein n=1 Tax=Bacillus sp. SORGH_AS_0510 TaxID=3041771 RepID=UPI00278042A2|nr:magnesium transporter CorA family protein [Bacillus sp. SORGH_AS_0510]MDQ1143596.1 magnesium transporter [Bacillus sp. SORGH_AS_0510]
MKTYQASEDWTWIQATQGETEDILPFLECESTDWLRQIQKNKTNSLRVSITPDGKKVVKGSLIYQQSFTDERDVKLFHFYVTTDRWITIDLDYNNLRQIETKLLHRQIAQTSNAVEGFMLFIAEWINEMLVEIDQFEEDLKTLIWSIRKRNETGILELVYMRRHELLVWKSLLIPVKELKMAIEEVNLHEGSEGKIFPMTCKRIERALTLIQEYEHELDSIINLEEVISSHRGNEITKTLTVITTVFTPIMAFGALWGMNFKHMPELEWRWGYPLSIGLIVISTILLYAYLKVKGWTGDLLKGKKRGSFFK